MNGEEFAAFLFLPIAMARGENLMVCGSGSAVATKNLRKLADSWAVMVPEMYSPIAVDFEAERSLRVLSSDRKLMFYSGGVDSTFALLRQFERGESVDLLTLQGMEYRLSKDVEFDAAEKKTDIFARDKAGSREFMKTDAYYTYKTYGVSGQMSHVFLLASSGFIYSSRYRSSVISSDFSCAQQFLAFPVGSTFATNQLFDAGDFHLDTEGEDVSRAEKCKFIGINESAIQGLSFCGRGRFRPENCGKCSKCVRTKVMFVASLGVVPSGVFIDSTLSARDVRMEMSSKEGVDFAFVIDAYIAARKSGYLGRLPGLVKKYEKVVSKMKDKRRENVLVKKNPRWRFW